MTAVEFPAETKSMLPLFVIVMFEVPSIKVPVKNDAETKFPPSTLPAVKLPPDTLPVACYDTYCRNISTDYITCC